MKHQVVIPLILLLMVGVITTAFGENEWQRGDVEKVMEPSPPGQEADKLNLINEEPVNDYEVDKSTEEIDLQDGSEMAIDVSPAKENLSTTESLSGLPLPFRKFVNTEQERRKLSKKDKSSKKSKKTAKSDKKSKKKSSEDSESEEPQPTPQPTPEPTPETYFLPVSSTAVHVVAHEIIDARSNNADTFWSTWKEGAKLATAGRSSLQWHAVGYDANAAVNALSYACSSGDAVVVTVPYASTTDEYRMMDEAINQCIAEGIPVFTANTDTYHNENVHAFFGSSNFDMGEKCALAVLFPDDMDIAQGRKEAPRLSENRNNIQIYWDAASRQNEGLRQRLEGLKKTFARHFQKVTTFEPSGREDCPCVQDYGPDVYVNDGEGLRIKNPVTGDVFDYPPGYGLNVCGEHDRNLGPDCAKTEPEEFCFSKWCYVDQNNCETDYDTEGEYMWEDYSGQEYPYSYATCGENNVYLNFLDGTDSGGVEAVGLGGLGVQTIVLSSDWAPKFDPSNPNSNIFICGEESTTLIGIPQVGQSPFMQGLSATSAAIAAATALQKGIRWDAYKGNAASTSTSQVFHSSQQRTSQDLTEPLSRYGKAIVNRLDQYQVFRGITWDIWHDAVFEDDWILQHPPPKYIGQPSRNLNVPQCCTKGNANNINHHAPCIANSSSTECNFEYGLYECETDNDCKAKEFFDRPNGEAGPYLTGEEMQNCLAPEGNCATNTYFNAGTCEEVSATRNEEGGSAEKLCVGHSHDFYERIYNHIIQAEHLVEITSLDSFDLIGTTGEKGNGNLFVATVRNALSYLSKTGKKITVKCHFGSIAGGYFSSGNEESEKILNAITSGMISSSDMAVWVGTYRYSTSSWNHGKIIAIDGKKLITGGSNYYSTHYLREDPIHDVSLQVSGGPAITAHRYAQRLWRTSCDLWTLPGFNQISYYATVSHRRPDGTKETNNYGLNSCPTAIDSLIEDDVLEDVPDDENRPKTGKSVITAARLATLASGIQGGSHTSDIAMLAMIDEAQESIKFSQQDMLPLILGETVGATYSLLTSNSGFTEFGRLSSASFDDTWRIIGGIAKAIARGVDVYMMLSAPCAFGGDSIYAWQVAALNTDQIPGSDGLYTQYRCPEDGSETNGFDYWERVFQPVTQTNQGYTKWPVGRDEDEEWAHIYRGNAFNNRRKLTDEDDEKNYVQHDTESAHRRLSYGYGWSLENVADWIFAYYMINKDSRPKKNDGESMTADEIAQHICTHAHIGHIRVTAEEDTYDSGGQVGNHAKIVMVDEKIFYIGSDNAYGSGLAEFGMITDDADITAEFNEKYWVPLWTQSQGTESDPGLVSGGSAETCKWRDALESRGAAPWNDITHAWCRTMNSRECKEAENDGCAWVDTALPHIQCNFAPQDKSCWIETDYCTGQLVKNGEYCWEDAVCESQYCTFSLDCKDKLEQGERCVEHDDCELGWCSYTNWKCDGEKLENGEFCVIDRWCKSGRCGSLSFECEDKLADNSGCTENDSCMSDKCNFMFECGYQNYMELCLVDSDCYDGFCNNILTCGKLLNGETCAWDTDCESDRCDNSFTCNDLLPNGASCFLSNNCFSGLCNNVLTCGILEDGEGCWSDNDCESNKCNWQFTCGEVPNGSLCDSDSDCTSNRCTNLFICAAKKGRDERCWNDGDCNSNQCKSFWTGWYCT